MQNQFCEPCTGHGLTGSVLKRVEPMDVLEYGCTLLGSTKEELMSPSRKRKFVEDRYMLVIFMRLNRRFGVKEIGECFNRDHTIVAYANSVVKKLCYTYPSFKEKLSLLIETLNNKFSYEPVNTKIRDKKAA